MGGNGGISSPGVRLIRKTAILTELDFENYFGKYVVCKQKWKYYRNVGNILEKFKLSVEEPEPRMLIPIAQI